MKRVSIYTLSDPRSGDVRYVGKSVQPAERLYLHIFHAKNGKQSHSARWIRQVLASGHSPIMSIIEEATPEIWEDRERFWIAHYRNQGANLTNITAGGDGVDAPRTDEWRRRIGESHLGKTVSESVRRRLREVNPATHATHCRRGHEYTPENTRLTKEGHRQCKTCANGYAEADRRAAGIKPRDQFQAEREPAQYCNRGHELIGENLRILSRPGRNGRAAIEERICRACVRQRNTECKRRKRGAK